MQVEAVALTSFVHDHLRPTEGQVLRLAESLARDLEREGLVRIKMKHKPLPLPAAAAGKVAAAGQARPSSASPVAQVSQPTTSPSLKRGAKARHGGTP